MSKTYKLIEQEVDNTFTITWFTLGEEQMNELAEGSVRGTLQEVITETFDYYNLLTPDENALLHDILCEQLDGLDEGERYHAIQTLLQKLK